MTKNEEAQEASAEQEETTEETSDDSQGEESTDETTSEESKDKSEESEHIDFEKELEIERDRRKKAEFTIEKERSKRLAQKSETEEVDEELDSKIENSKIEKGVIAAMTKLDERRSIESAKNTIRERATTPQEAELAIWHYDNSIRATGDSTADAENALALANKKRVASIAREAQKSVNKPKTGGNPPGKRPQEEIKEPTDMDPSEKRFLLKRGYKWNAKTGEWDKPKKSK